MLTFSSGFPHAQRERGRRKGAVRPQRTRRALGIMAFGTWEGSLSNSAPLPRGNEAVP